VRSSARRLLASALALVAAAAAGGVREEREVMHTVVTVVLADPHPDAGVEAALDDAFRVFEDIDATMNEWRPESPLGRINASAGGPATPAPAPLCEVLQLALDGSRRTHGLFDPTWAALRDLWRFGNGAPPRVPSAEEVKERCRLVGATGVQLTPRPDGGCTVRLPRAGMKLGLGGLVKGWGVDRAAARLRARGFNNFFIQAGGDLYFGGKNGDRPWRAGIRDPRGPPDQVFARLEVSDRAFSTSGDYEHFFEVDGVRYHHILDLRTCTPARSSRSVTVLARSASDAELLTKAAFVLGKDAGLALVQKWGAQAVIVDEHNRVHVSKGLEATLRWTPPTP
jgi:thiamine biosynthesis lipoprotein